MADIEIKKYYLPEIPPGEPGNIDFFNGSSILSFGSLQSPNFVKGKSGWQLTSDGNLEANKGTFRGSLVAGELHIPDENTTANSFHVDPDGNVWWGATHTNFDADNDNAAAYVLKTGQAKFQNVRLSGNVELSDIANNSNTDISLLTFSHDITFSSTDADTVSWGSGTITLSNGRTFSIDAGNTGNMVARTLIYLDTAVSSTVLQTTTSPSAAVGANKILIAVAENATESATFQVTGGVGGLAIDEDQVFIPNLAAINADMGAITAGTITLDTSGYIRGGQTAYNTGTGFFLGYSGGAYKLSIGDPSGKHLLWTGSDLVINGYLAATQGAFGGDGSDGAKTVSTSENIDASSANVVIKNYSSLTINASQTLGLTNPASDGTVLILKVQGDCTINGKIDLSECGANGGSGGTSGGGADNGDDGTASFLTFGEDSKGGGGNGSDPSTVTGGGGGSSTINNGTAAADNGAGAGGTGGARCTIQPHTEAATNIRKMVVITVGGGGGGGGANGGGSGGRNGGNGGKGGGGLIIEVGGDLTFGASSEIDLSGGNGSAGTGGNFVGGGGGGGAGMGLILYNGSLTDSGVTLTASGGTGGGNTGGTDGGEGADGTILVIKNQFLA